MIEYDLIIWAVISAAIVVTLIHNMIYWDTPGM